MEGTEKIIDNIPDANARRELVPMAEYIRGLRSMISLELSEFDELREKLGDGKGNVTVKRITADRVSAEYLFVVANLLSRISNQLSILMKISLHEHGLEAKPDEPIDNTRQEKDNEQGNASSAGNN